jgi:hypothetical protein
MYFKQWLNTFVSRISFLCVPLSSSHGIRGGLKLINVDKSLLSLLYTIPTTNVWHSFAEYLFIFNKQGLKISSFIFQNLNS